MGLACVFSGLWSMPRRGVSASLAVIKDLMKGVEWGADDIIAIFDVLPNKCFAQWEDDRLLVGSGLERF